MGASTQHPGNLEPAGEAYRPIRAVIFDLDGVLVDSEPLLFEAERRMLAEYGVELTPEVKRPLVGMGGHDVIQALIDHFDLDADVATMAERKLELYQELAWAVAGNAATIELAQALHADGTPLAIASGSAPEGIAIALTAIGLTDAFTVRVSTQHVAHGKPAPDVFLAAADRLGVPAAHCVVIEDAAPGVRAAHTAGMRCIAIPSVTKPLDPAFETADLLVPGGMADARSDDLITWIRARS